MANAENIKNNDLNPVTGRNEDTPHIINVADLSQAEVSVMLRKWFLLISSLLFIQVQAYPGFRQITLSDQKEEPLNVAVWYPALSGGVTENVGDNAAFTGVSIIRNALLYRGTSSYCDLTWLQRELAESVVDC